MRALRYSSEARTRETTGVIRQARGIGHGRASYLPQYILISSVWPVASITVIIPKTISRPCVRQAVSTIVVPGLEMLLMFVLVRLITLEANWSR